MGSEPAERARSGIRGRGIALTAPSLLRSRPVIQSAVFTGSNIVVNLLGLVATAVLARTLGPDGFGEYAFAVAFLVFVAMFFDFGVFLPAARLAATASGNEQRRVVGAAVLAFLPIGLAFICAVFALSFAVDAVVSESAGHALRVSAPLALAYPFVQVALQLSQGVDRLHVSSITTAIGQGAFVVFLLAALGALAEIPISLALTLRGAALIIAGIVFLVWIRPLFADARRHFAPLLRDTRVYGFSVYVGRVLSSGTYSMDTLMLAAFADARAVGYYVLAGTIAYASGLPVLGLGTALFATMARRDSIARRWLVAAWAIGLLAVGLVWALAPLIVEAVFSSSYLPVVGLVLPLALAQMVRGVTSIYNNYLAAHAEGRALRNAAIVLTVSNVVLNFALIPPYGAKGAAWASLGALTLNFVAHVFYYRRSVPMSAESVA